MNEFEKKLTEFKELFGLHNWRITLQQVETTAFAAKTLADPRYHKADMEVGTHIIQKPNEWEAIIVHELIHIVNALYDYFADNLGKDGTDELFFIARESACSQMTSVILRLIKENEKNN